MSIVFPFLNNYSAICTGPYEHINQPLPELLRLQRAVKQPALDPVVEVPLIRSLLLPFGHDR